MSTVVGWPNVVDTWYSIQIGKWEGENVIFDKDSENFECFHSSTNEFSSSFSFFFYTFAFRRCCFLLSNIFANFPYNNISAESSTQSMPAIVTSQNGSFKFVIFYFLNNEKWYIFRFRFSLCCNQIRIAFLISSFFIKEKVFALFLAA